MLVPNEGMVGTAVPGVLSGGGVFVIVGLVAVGLTLGLGVFVIREAAGVGVNSSGSGVNVAEAVGVTNDGVSASGVSVIVGVFEGVGEETVMPSSFVGVGSKTSGKGVSSGADVLPSGTGPKPGSGLGCTMRSTCKYQIKACGASLPQPDAPSYNRQTPSTVKVVPDGTSFSTFSKPYPLS